LEQGFVEFDGKFIKQPRVPIHPAPFRTFRGRTYAAAVSVESFQIMADLGVGILIIPQKPWEVHAAETESYRQAYRERNGAEAPPPAVLAFVYCDEDEDRARETARQYVGNYWKSVMKHYELSSGHLANTKGYEYYGAMQGMIEGGATEALTDMFIDLQVWGTPEQCIEKVRAIRDRVRNDTVVCAFKFGGLPYETAERSMRLFARTVRPRLEDLSEPPTLQLVAGGRS
jgi:alkanesulfonate monooxygenase SsuD/methylene tetrahydromethanopterin reductase-like flavin-dependent oxidoreductase (luciferase family)